MVFESIVERAVDSHCTCDGVVSHCALNTSARGFVHFIDSTHINGLASVGLDLLHEIAIAIIDELGGLSTDCHRDQAVFGIESLIVGQAAFHALSHIAVGVVGVSLAGGEGCNCVLVGGAAMPSPLDFLV